MMLRRKTTFVTSLYKLGKSSYGAKHFHLSRSVLLRKGAASKKTSQEFNTVTETVAGEFLAPSGKTNINANFYGIESDEGVIDIEQRSRSIKLNEDVFINQLNDKLNRERVKNARFGSIRWDGENKPMFHGHFENNKITKSADEVDVIPINSETYNKSIDFLYSTNTSETTVQSKHLSTVDSDEIIDNQIDTERKENCDSKNGVSFIDDLYFAGEVLDGRFSDKPVSEHLSKVSDSSGQEKTQNTNSSNDKSVSFLDELYFTNELVNTKSDYKSVENTSKASDGHQETLQDSNLKNNRDFLDELNLQNKAGQSFSDEDPNPRLSADHVKSGGFSFIDESYFDSNLIHEHNNSSRDLKDKANVRTRNDINSPNVNDAKNEKRGIEGSIDPLNYSKNNQEYKNIDNFNINVAFGNLKPESDSLSSDLNEYNTNLNAAGENVVIQAPLPNYKTKDPPSHKLKDEVKVKENLKNLFKENLSGNVMQRDRKSIEKVQETNPSNSIKTLQETKRDDRNSIDDIDTAHDFVHKLRAEKKEFRPLIKGGKILPTQEKQDSKGFRILSNQVPKLSYFTRDEIMTVLKNNVLYSDDDIVVLNKPYNLVIHESKTSKDPSLSEYLDELAVALDNQSRDPKLFTVHRIDKETCGCLLLARNEIAAQRLLALFAQRKIEKTYWIVTIAVPDPLEGVIDIPITEGSVDNKARMVLHPTLPRDIHYENHSRPGKRAVTYYKVISTSGSAALVEVKPETGVKHQIRVHFGFGLSCPILGDHKYSHLNKMAPQKLQSDLLQKLHVRQSKVRHIPMHIYARSILIPQYREGRNLFVMAPMPTHMSINLQRLKFRKN